MKVKNKNLSKILSTLHIKTFTSKLFINFTLFIIYYLHVVVNSFFTKKISNFVITDLTILFQLIFDE